MIDSPSYSGTGSASSDDTHALFGQTMGYVAATAGFFALGAYVGRDLSYGWAFVGFIAAFACLIGMDFTARQSGSASVGLLFAVGLLLGLAMSPTLTYYAGVNPQALWQAGGATALFIAGWARLATPPGEICPGSPAWASGHSSRSSCSAS